MENNNYIVINDPKSNYNAILLNLIFNITVFNIIKMNKDFVYLGYTNHFNDKTKIGKTSCLGSRVSQMNTSYSSHSFCFRLVINIIKDSAIDGTSLEHILHQEYIEDKIEGNAGQ